MNLKEEVAYISGMMEGFQLDMNTKEAKLFDAILGILEDMATEIDNLQQDVDDLNEFVDDMDEDLYECEKEIGLADEDCDCCCDDEDDCDCCCGCEEEEDIDDEDFVDVKCPNCGEVVCFDPKVLWDSDEDVEVLCPNCDAVVFSSDMVEDECECGCCGEESKDEE